MMILFFLTVGVGVGWLALFLVNLRVLRRAPVVQPMPPSGEPLPKVSVIIPARDEENNIGPCLRSLQAQDHRDLELIVVDDHSSDRTAAVVEQLQAEDPRIRLVRSSDPPPGWMGKCHALSEGVRQGKPGGEWLLFVDADTVHVPQSVSSAVRSARQEGVDLLSLIPHLEGRSFWERLVQPAVAALIALFNRPEHVNDPDRPEVFANGQYILVRRQVYEQVGGHSAVACKVLEDVELARAVFRAGFRIRLALGRSLFATRMYPSLRSLVNGWTKNFYLILHSRLRQVLTAATISLLFSLWPAVTGIGAAAALATNWRPYPEACLWAMVGIYAVVLVFQVVLRALNGWYPAYAPLAPVGNLVAVFILLRSAMLHLRGKGVLWKGREVFDDREGGP